VEDVLSILRLSCCTLMRSTPLDEGLLYFDHVYLTFEEGVHFVEASILFYCTCGISPPYYIVVD
jgi:hypothetical protein